MAKTNMLMREKKRLKVAKKYATRRAELKELIRDPKTGQEGREAAQVELRKQPRGRQPGSATAARSPAVRAACTANSGWRAPSARGRQPRRNPRPFESELVRRTWRDLD
jgi:hypothetical protein